MKTIIFDFDGTLTKRNNEIWGNIWVKLEAVDVDEYLYNKFNNKEINYDEWCREIEKEYIKRNFNKDLLEDLIKNIELLNDLSDGLEILSKKYELRILSGGIDYVINYLLKDNVKYFSDIKSCEFIFDNDGYLASIINKDSDNEGKRRYIEKYIKDNKINPSDILFVGNGNNDRFVSQSGCRTLCLNHMGTDHLNKDIWHDYLENVNSMLDVCKKIEEMDK